MQLEQYLMTAYAVFFIAFYVFMITLVEFTVRGRFRHKYLVEASVRGIFKHIELKTPKAKRDRFFELVILAVLVFAALYYNMTSLAGAMILGYLIGYVFMKLMLFRMKNSSVY